MTLIINKEKIIFIKGSKVAGSSFELALSKFTSDNDIITPLNNDEEILRQELEIPNPKNYEYKYSELFKKNKTLFIKSLILWKKYPKFETHETAENIQKKISPKTWSDYKKIAIIRNPYTFLVSAYYWANRNNKFNDINEFVENRVDVLDRFKKFYFIENSDVVDIYLRFENLNEDILHLESLYPSFNGLKTVFSEFNLKKGIKPKNLVEIELLKKYPNLIQKINKKMQYFFEKFNYEMINI